MLSQGLGTRLNHSESACLSVFETNVSNVKENDVIL